MSTILSIITLAAQIAITHIKEQLALYALKRRVNKHIR